MLGLLGLAGLSVPAGCVAAPTPQDWLAVGHRTPAQTFATFCTALAGDEPGLEYRCLSRGFKARHDLNELAYREFRDELLKKSPWFRHLARARVLYNEQLADGRVRIKAEVAVLWTRHRFQVDLVREEAYEYYDADGLLDDDYAAFDTIVRPFPNDAKLVLLTVPAPYTGALTDLVEVRVLREWKLDALKELPSP